MKFQVISWESNDQLVDGSNTFCIDMFGRCANGKSVSARVSFTPYFFIEVPKYTQKHNVHSDIEQILPDYYKPTPKAYTKSYSIMNEMTISLVDRKKFFGFTNNKAFRFALLVFRSKKSFKLAFWALSKSRKYKDKIYEANLDPILRFIHLTGIQSAGWVEVKSYNNTDVEQKETSCDLEITISDWKSVVPVAEDSIAPIVIASFDIETYSPDGSFPDPEKPGCPIIQIATTLQTYGQTGYTRHLHTLNECLPIEDVQIHAFETERELIVSWCELVKIADPDVLVGYNIWKFDNVYLYKRADLLQISHLFCLNRYRAPSRCYKASFSSGAYGDNNYEMVTSQGRFQIDLLELYKREHKLVKYSLNFVSEHFLGDCKVDMPIKEMFERYRHGTPEDMRKIGEYCVKDTELPLRLMEKLANIPNLVEMARATYVPMNFLIERGQQIKCFSQIVKQAQLEQMLVPTIQDGKTNESFVGATVLEAKTAAYMNGVITGLDFASLYPTIMRAHNLCYNSIVLDEKYNNLPGIEYKTVEWTTKEAKHFKYTFAQNPTGILPKLLETLAKNRKQAKKDMANASDPFMKDVYNGKQLAFKVSMNSIYGFCSAFMLPCQAISASVTTIGREMIEQTKTLVEEWYPNAEVVYGDTDSVMVKFDTTDAKNDLEMREISFRLGEEAAGRISQTFKYPIELEFEKCYQPYLLFSKKRYAGLMYTQVAKPDYIDAKGIQLVRRDNAPFVKDISKQVLNMIMYDQDILGSIDKVQDVARKLLNYEFSIDQLVISKSIRNDYVNRNHAHVKVADKIEQRNPGAGPKSGERVPYIIMDNGERLLCDRAEDPAYVVEKGLEYKVDVLYYLTNGLISPLESFYDLFMDHSKEGIFGDMIRDFENQRKGLRNGSTLNQFYERTKEKQPLVEKKKALLVEKANEPAKKTQRTINLFF